MSHTPGPWHTGRFSGMSYVYDNCGECTPVRYVYRNPEERIPVLGGNSDDDARLIAAAPELLELVKELYSKPYGLKYLSKLSEDACKTMIENTWLPKFKAVIAKAEGRE